ncbi:histidine kinase N-terminal 7TM domain-containing protein [Psychrobacillus sp. BL-248-WT-3]|uniref:histidine kinase N-terminal 7TM domain-containing diguanylate cyclase n=1 Tax=Psychrobacillus sp. BL-248-WT-3 TaxID=2725306 RepID=UPI00197F22C6|nr:histidine kinase N-terminal 7TM domain-containing protein [Psychrobacillus sp. BL-248-WT-3]
MTHILVVTLAGIISLFLSLYIRVKAKDAPGVKPYIFVTILSSVFTFAYAFELASTTLKEMKFWLGVEYLAMPFIPVFVLFMCMEYVGRKIKTWNYAIFIIPITTIFMMQTNDLHHLYYKSMKINRDGPFPLLELEWGPWFNVHAIFLFLCLTISVFLLLKEYRKSLFLFRMQTLLMVAGFITPIIANYFYLNDWSEGIDLGPISLSIAFTFHGIALISLQMFNVAPIARDSVFESLKEGVLVLNQNKVIVDYNKAALIVIPTLSSHHIGKAIAEVLDENPKLKERLDEEIESDYTSLLDEQVIHFRINFTEVMNKSGLRVGKIITFINVTEKVQMEEKLKQLASIDGLTQVLNRTFFMKKTEVIFDDISIDGGNISIVMFDIDHFKRVNDTYGHEAGDVILTSVTSIVKKKLRSTDYMGRYGGEEFIICMPDTSLIEAANRANIIRQEVEDSLVAFYNEEIQVTSSFGISHALLEVEEDRYSIQQLIREADQALYTAKNKGRNCVALYNADELLLQI